MTQENSKRSEEQCTPSEKAGNRDQTETRDPNQMLVIPVRGTVLFPHNVLPLTAGKEWTDANIELALKTSEPIGLAAQIDLKLKGEPDLNDLYSVGTEAKILKVIRFPDGTQGAVVQGVRRFRILGTPDDPLAQPISGGLRARVEYMTDEQDKKEDSIEISALGRGLRQLVQRAVTLSPNVPNEANVFVESVTDPSYLADLVIPYLDLEFKLKQELLETPHLMERLKKVHTYLTREIEVLEVSQRIHSEVRSEVGKQQRKYYLREQMKQLQKELGDLEGRESSGADEISDLTEKIDQSAMSQEAKEIAHREVERLQMMQPGSPEYMVGHTYVSWLLDIPWGIETQKPVDLKVAQKILDDDHYGLEKIKKRIIEYLAVYSLKPDLKGPILLLSGPPGVGKTSLGRSISKALGRNFVRISLGGLKDEAEIRGHRRTYIGSMPGKIIDALKKAGSSDPVILLDEIDKIGQDMRGDPASALLEVLDPEQNDKFMDHYLNTPVDLSKVMFVATANTTNTIPAPLLDRMEPVSLAGYTLNEKVGIATRFLIPQVSREHGLEERTEILLSKKTLEDLIEGYTREAGVRQLKRELAGLCRGVAKDLAEKMSSEPPTEKKRRKSKTRLGTGEVTQLLGAPLFQKTSTVSKLPFGVALGLAYTPVGGDVLYIETAWNPSVGQGRLLLTGQLGSVMQESVQTALSYIKANSKSLGLDLEQLSKNDIHVHFPEGAIQKDGPSAGIAVLCALYSLSAQRRISSKLAMTGEISLRGAVLPVGGIKEKLLGAHRAGVREVILPKLNEKDLDDLPKDIRADLRIHLVSKMQEVLEMAFPDEELEPKIRRSKSNKTASGPSKKVKRAGALAQRKPQQKGKSGAHAHL